MSVDDELALARRLRQLRETLSPAPSQEQLGAALGVSRQQVAQWESSRSPKVPPESRIEQYARLFAVGQADPVNLRVKERSELTGVEAEEFAGLQQELLELRARAVDAGPNRVDDSVGWFWRFEDDRPITIIGSTEPASVTRRIPEADSRHPDYTKLLRNADADAEIELYSHLRAANPTAWITRYLSEEDIPTGALNGHVVVLGGRTVNRWADWFTRHMDVPVGNVPPEDHLDSVDAGSAQEWVKRSFRVAREAYVSSGAGEATAPAGATLDEGDGTWLFRPEFEGTVSVPMRGGGTEEGPGLYRDVALIARRRNPLNVAATATLIYGLFARGTVGAVQTFTDRQYIPSNEAYVASRSLQPVRQQDFWVLLNVLCDRNFTITPTPQLGKAGTVLLEAFG